MLGEGRLPLSPAEHRAVDKLTAENENAAISFARRDPGEVGPLVVHVDEDTYLVDADGKRSKQRKRSS